VALALGYRLVRHSLCISYADNVPVWRYCVIAPDRTRSTSPARVASRAFLIKRGAPTGALAVVSLVALPGLPMVTWIAPHRLDDPEAFRYSRTFLAELPTLLTAKRNSASVVPNVLHHVRTSFGISREIGFRSNPVLVKSWYMVGSRQLRSGLMQRMKIVESIFQLAIRVSAHIADGEWPTTKVLFLFKAPMTRESGRAEPGRDIGGKREASVTCWWTGRGIPLSFIVTAASVNDITMFEMSNLRSAWRANGFAPWHGGALAARNQLSLRDSHAVH